MGAVLPLSPPYANTTVISSKLHYEEILFEGTMYVSLPEIQITGARSNIWCPGHSGLLPRRIDVRGAILAPHVREPL